MRMSIAMESAAGLGAGAAIANVYPLQPGSNAGPPTICLRRLVLGGYGTNTEQQVSVKLGRATPGAPGTETYLLPMDSAAQVITANFNIAAGGSNFSVDPSIWEGPLYEFTFNTTGRPIVVEWGYGEFQMPYISAGAGLGSALYNVVAVPSDFIYTASFEVDFV